MEDVTIIIQGKLEQDSYDFYIQKYFIMRPNHTNSAH